jgi:hypothetical protein
MEPQNATPGRDSKEGIGTGGGPTRDELVIPHPGSPRRRAEPRRLSRSPDFLCNRAAKGPEHYQLAGTRMTLPWVFPVHSMVYSTARACVLRRTQPMCTSYASPGKPHWDLTESAWSHDAGRVREAIGKTRFPEQMVLSCLFLLTGTSILLLHHQRYGCTMR